LLFRINFVYKGKEVLLLTVKFGKYVREDAPCAYYVQEAFLAIATTKFF